MPIERFGANPSGQVIEAASSVVRAQHIGQGCHNLRNARRVVGERVRQHGGMRLCMGEIERTAERALKKLGMPESGIDLATDRALANPYWNPRVLEREPIRDLIARAFAGEPPGTSTGSLA